LSVSYSNIENSENTIWHLTVAPEENQYFTECDMIKLTSMFGSSQEESKLKDEIRITIKISK